MNIVTVDLDDTLIKTHHYYEQALQIYVDYMNNKFGFDKNRIRKLQKDIDLRLLYNMGLSKERYPTSFVYTTRRLLSNYNKKEEQKSRKIAEQVFKSERAYEENGFIKNSEKLIKLLKNKYDRLHIITAGVESVQLPKIKALKLNELFDDVHIVEMGTKHNTIQNIRQKYNATNITHIGNSYKSDVQAALKANANAIYIPNAEWMDKKDINYTSNENIKKFNSITEYINTEFV